MKKNRNLHPLPWLTVICGGLLALCRHWLQSAGIDENGLYATRHIADTLSYLLLALGMLTIWLFVRNLQGDGQTKDLFPASSLGALGCVAGAIGIFLSVIVEKPAQPDAVWFLHLLTGCFAAVALLFAAHIRLKGRSAHYFLHSAVTVFFLIRLVFCYRTWSSEPQIQVYFFPLLASVFLLVWVYQRTCLDAGFGSRKYYAFFHHGVLLLCLAGAIGNNGLSYLCMAIWAATNLCRLSQETPVVHMVLPKDVAYCIRHLEQAGYHAYAVGGCVRDHLLGLIPHDYDLCTNATPAQIARVFAKHELVRNGEKHGTIGVIRNGQVYEITTFRTEGTYSDGRHPDSVAFVADLKTDLARRDFTVNAMAYNPKTGLIDPFGGHRDLQNKVLRAVGDPQIRFREDALRILRGVRFALRFDLKPEKSTLNAMLALTATLDQLASERVYSELAGILPLLTAESLKTYRSIITQVIPELKACVDFDQHSHHHAYDVYSHTAYVTEAVSKKLVLRFAALLHDIGKPVVFYRDEAGAGHFPEHARVGAEIADAILRRLKAPNELRNQVVFLVAHHMTPFEPDRTLLRRRLSKYGLENCCLLLQLQQADFCSKGVRGESPDFGGIEAMLHALAEESTCLHAKDLAVNGHDLMALGYEPGPKLGQVVQALFQQVVDETLPNDKQILLEKAKELMEEKQ